MALRCRLLFDVPQSRPESEFTRGGQKYWDREALVKCDRRREDQEKQIVRVMENTLAVRTQRALGEWFRVHVRSNHR